MKHVITLSYGVGSWAAGKRVVERYGPADVVLLNTDTKYEDEDTYAWGKAAAANIGVPLVEIAEGRDPWQVFFDERMLGNTRVDPCSKKLKREMLARWLEANCDRSDTVVYFGIHYSEKDRFERWDSKLGKWLGIKPRMEEMGWDAEAPLLWPPIPGAVELHDWAAREGLWKQKLYRLGFPHANCGGRCVKQGQAGWKLLLQTIPERYAECEAKEEAFRQMIGKDVAIMRDRRGGDSRPLTLREFRERVEAGEACSLFDFGGCSCFAGDE
jgi:hypothetical protein